MNSIVPKIHDSEADIALESLKMYKDSFINNSAKFREKITSNQIILDQKRIDQENEEIKKDKINNEKNLIIEFESIVESETKTLKTFINKFEQNTLLEIPNHIKKYYININNQIEKFISELNNFPDGHEKYKNVTHSGYDEIENRVRNIKQEIGSLKSEITSDENNLRIVESKLSTLKDFENKIGGSMKEILENDRDGGYKEIANKIHKFIIKITNNEKTVLTLCRKCHGNGQCLACDNSGYITVTH